jgi:hypothetical protein
MPRFSGTQAINAGDITATVVGTFTVPPYQAGTLSTGWNTTVVANTKTPSSFLLTFGTPAPPGGSTFDWEVITPAGLSPPVQTGSTLQDYLQATRRLLRDETTGVYSTVDLTAWINQSMQQRDLDLGINRVRIAFAMLSGVFQYTFAQILNGGSLLTGPIVGAPIPVFSATQPVGAGDTTAIVSGPFVVPYQAGVLSTSWDTTAVVSLTVAGSFLVTFGTPCPPGGGTFDWLVEPPPSLSVNVIDLVSIIVLPQGSATGAPRYPMGRWPYSKLAYLLSQTGPTYPVYYAIYGPGTVMVGPPPAGNYPAEWDFTAYSPPLILPTDLDPVPYP